MTPPDRPLPVPARPGRGGNPGGNPGVIGGDSAGELLWWALRAVNVHDLVVFPVRRGGKTPAVRGWQQRGDPRPGAAAALVPRAALECRDRDRPLGAAGDRPRRRPRPRPAAAVALGAARTRRVRPARRRGR